MSEIEMTPAQRKMAQFPALKDAYHASYRSYVARHATLERARAKLIEDLAAKEAEIMALITERDTAYGTAASTLRIQIDEDTDVVPQVVKVSEDELVLAVGDDELLILRPTGSGSTQYDQHYYGKPDAMNRRDCLSCPIPHQITWRSQPVATLPRAP